MFFDILGYKLTDGIDIIEESGGNKSDIIISRYSSPRNDVIGNDERIVKVNRIDGKIVLVVCNF